MMLRTMLLIASAIALVTSPRTTLAQTYRIYGLPDTMYVGQTAQVYGLSLTGTSVCPDCWFDATDTLIASRPGPAVPGWGTAAHVAITADAPGTTTVYGVVYKTTIRFSKSLVVVGPAPARIAIYCGASPCPATDTVPVAQTLQLTIVAYDSTGSVIWSELRTLKKP